MGAPLGPPDQLLAAGTRAEHRRLRGGPAAALAATRRGGGTRKWGSPLQPACAGHCRGQEAFKTSRAVVLDRLANFKRASQFRWSKTRPFAERLAALYYWCGRGVLCGAGTGLMGEREGGGWIRRSSASALGPGAALLGRCRRYRGAPRVQVCRRGCHLGGEATVIL